ncbi:type IV secretion system DNA-binding domain-containing protein [Trichloromonas sp.]|uniref:type IV secretion system DNA-binding domain-containing protein n=1 Tax=Trichloromonas sp. TaxID=3069249 RepID=UPI002A4A1522|nr:type IV secretion system DNA-binding domain-containing protein [Trichloromonas sp.]
MREKTMEQPRDWTSTTACLLFFPTAAAVAAGAALTWAIHLCSAGRIPPGELAAAAAGLIAWPWQSAPALAGAYAAAGGLYQIFPWLVLIPALAAAGGGAWAGWRISAPAPGRQHLAGPTLMEGAKSLKTLQKELAAEGADEEPGIDIYPGVALSRDRESKHFLVCGGTGAGKTTVLAPMVAEIVERGDRVLIYDNKGEWTEKLKNGIILAPWDARGVAWDIAADVQNEADAFTLAEYLAPTGKGGKTDFFSSAAAAILVGILKKFITEKPGKWTLRDVILEAGKPYAELRQIIAKYSETMAGALPEESNKTTDSLRAVLAQMLSGIQTLATAWEGKHRISLRKWLHGGYSEKGNVLLVQGSGRYRQLQQSYIKAIFHVLGGAVADASLKESNTRRVWLILDEIAQIGEPLPAITQILETGRSKGVCAMIGIQNISQIRELYGQNIAETWASICGTYIIGRTQGAESQEFLSKTIGKEKIRKYMPAWSGGQRSGAAEQRQDSWQEVEEPIFYPAEIATELGKSKNGVKLVLVGVGSAVHLLEWPFSSMPKLRKSEIPAAWTKSPQTPGEAAAAAAAAAAGAAAAAPSPSPSPSPSIISAAAAAAVAAAFERDERAAALPPDVLLDAAPEQAPEQEQEHDDPAADEIAAAAAEELAEEVAPGLGEIIPAAEIGGDVLDFLLSDDPAPAPVRQQRSFEHENEED